MTAGGESAPDESVTGSCEQCGRRYALLVPEPGSGELALRRVTAVFGWCAECGQLVGRECCWGPDGSCARCAQARAASRDALAGFAALGAARAAVRQLDGTTAHFSRVEDAIAATAATLPGAPKAWERSWLAAGTLRARIDGGREAAWSWLRGLPGGEAERASELRDELLTVEASLEARWGAIEDALSEAGRRLARPRPKRLRSIASIVGGGPPRREAVAGGAPRRPETAARAIAVAVPVSIRAPDRAVIHVGAKSAAPAPAGPPVAVSTRTTVAPAVKPIAPAPPIPQGHWVSPPPARVTAPVAKVAAAPAPAVTPDRPGRPGRAASLLVAVVALALAAGILAVTRLPDAVADGTSGPPRITDPDPEATRVAGITSTTSPSPSAAGASATSATVMTVDEHPVGPLDPEEVPVIRIIGAPEVEAFPSPFDRSLRLGGPSAGLCVASPSADVPSLGFELHLAELGDGAARLVVSLSDRAPGLTLDLASLASLDRGAWYRLTVTGEEASGRAVVTAVADNRPLLEVDLAATASSVITTVGEACLHAEIQAADASVFVDNLRVDG